MHQSYITRKILFLIPWANTKSSYQSKDITLPLNPRFKWDLAPFVVVCWLDYSPKAKPKSPCNFLQASVLLHLFVNECTTYLQYKNKYITTKIELYKIIQFWLRGPQMNQSIKHNPQRPRASRAMHATSI